MPQIHHTTRIITLSMLITMVTYAQNMTCGNEYCECLSRPHALVFVACKSGEIREVPRELPLGTEHLLINDANIEALEENVFSHLPNLRTIELLNCNLHRIQPGAFRGLTKLMYIIMRDHKLRYIETNTFSGLTNPLTGITLTGNTIERIHDAAFIGLNVTDIELQGNPINHISNIAFKSSTVAHLYLSNCSLPGASLNWLTHLQNSLKILSITANQIPLVLPYNIFKVFDFNKLDLSKNGIKDYRFLTSVKTYNLDLDGNPIGNVDWENYPDLGSMKELSLRATGLYTLESHMFNNLNLDTLHLANNNISTIPESMRAFFTKIKMISIDNNPLRCNCELKWFKMWLVTNRNTRVFGASCVSPLRRELWEMPEMNMTCKAPSFIEIEEIYNRNANMVYLKCVSNGDPSPVITWELPDGTHTIILPTMNATQTITYGIVSRDNDVTVAGKYVCHVDNSHGTLKSVYNVTMYDYLNTNAGSAAKVEWSRGLISYFLMLFLLIHKFGRC